MKSKKIFIYLFLIFFLALACQQKGENHAPIPQANFAASAPPFAAPPELRSSAKRSAAMEDSNFNLEEMSKRQMIYTANLRIEVAKFKEAVEKVKEIAKEAEGFVSNSTSAEDDYQKLSGTLTLRIPEKSFQPTLQKIREVGKLKEENIQGEDVTEEYVDLEIRLKNKRELEKRLLEILKTQTNKVADILEVEKELARVREEIERAEGRKRFLDNRVQLATIIVTLFEPVPLTSSSQWGALGKAVTEIVSVFAKSVASLMLFIVGVLPWLIIGSVLIWILWRVGRRLVKKQ